jgi:soluble lytic murein transglycosylase-like protein
MSRRSRTSCLALTALLAAPAAWAGEVYSYVDPDGVIHVTNVPQDARFRRVRQSEVAGLYRPSRAATAAPASGPRATGLPGRPESYRGHIKEAAQKYQLPEALLAAVMAVESNFNARAISDKGAMGLMQLMPGTARELYVSDAWDPAQNIEGGARYLRLLANQYAGDLIKTLAAYNAGPEAVRRAGEAVPDIPETREYVRKVVALYQAFRSGR